MGYRISELARRSGFSPSTLRYYETAGLLPDPERTDSGYRVYDDAALERLAFIGRAKTMGLALEDIAELVGLWADGPCAPVQDRLKELLDAKVNEVRVQLDDLSHFAAQLDHLRRSLAATVPTERCGPGCGCDVELPAAIALTAKPAESTLIACTLSDVEAEDRAAEWADLLANVVERRATDRGVQLRLPPHPGLVAHAGELCVRETECCAFFSFTLTVDAGGVWLDVAAPDALAVIDALFGTAHD